MARSPKQPPKGDTQQFIGTNIQGPVAQNMEATTISTTFAGDASIATNSDLPTILSALQKELEEMKVPADKAEEKDQILGHFEQLAQELVKTEDRKDGRIRGWWNAIKSFMGEIKPVVDLGAALVKMGIL